MHKEFNSLCTDIAEKKCRPYLGHRRVPRVFAMLNLLGKRKSCKKNDSFFFHTPNYQNDQFYPVSWNAREARAYREQSFAIV